MTKLKFLLLPLCLPLLLASCGTGTGQALRDSDLLEGYAIMKLTEESVKGDEEKALKVRSIAAEIRQVATDDEYDKVDLLIAAVRVRIPWNKLSPADTMLAEEMLKIWRADLVAEFGEDILPEQARLSIEKVTGWVILAARA